MNGIIERYKYLLIQKRYSVNTIKMYGSYFADFCACFSPKDLNEITTAEINSYIRGRICDIFKNYRAAKILQRPSYRQVSKKAIDKIKNPMDDLFD